MKLKGVLADTIHARKLWRNPAAAFWFFWRSQDHAGSSPIGQFRYGNLEFVARLKDWNAVQEVLIEKEYGFVAGLHFGNRPSVIDLGANIGMFSLSIFSMWPSARVYALEPSLATFQILDCNRAANPALDWHIYRMAAWQSDGEVSFENRPYSTSSRINDSGIEIERVPAVRLETLLNQHVREKVDLLKIDIEGAEGVVLERSAAVLPEFEHVVVEIHPAAEPTINIPAILQDAFPYLYRVPGRRSNKPLLLATRAAQQLPPYAP
jgi:FkbM family methyltransferase